MISPQDNVLAEAQATAREQIAAAWQLHLEQVQQALAAANPEPIAQILDERLAEMAGTIERNGAAKARREVSSYLNQAARRLRNFESLGQWSQALIDAVGSFCERAFLFEVNGTKATLRAGSVTERAPEAIDLSAAPAFAEAVNSRDTVVAMRTRSELSEPFVKFAGESPTSKCYLLPIEARNRVAALLYADGEEARMDGSALELLATVAGSILGGQQMRGVVGIDAAPQRISKSWSDLSREEQDRHLRAQRAARVMVAEMRLYHAGRVKAGRTGHNLYGELRDEIDRSRETYRRDYLNGEPGMIDYLHGELLETLANNDAELLGPEYPGPLA